MGLDPSSQVRLHSMPRRSRHCRCRAGPVRHARGGHGRSGRGTGVHDAAALRWRGLRCPSGPGRAA
ncbi:MAG: hypothetical protein ACK4OE_21385 [Acidovorax sp.]|uniref:hypothetical protein n=1 Tax=Acidovorax sp. TaxID=1872122 RepID=UPI0039191471